MKSFNRSSLIAIAVLFTGVSLITPVLPTDSAQARSARTCNTQWVSAHRGLPSRSMTENTVGAFKSAIRNGAKIVETDLRLSKDGRWVLMHDSTINRTFKGSGTVTSKTVDQLMKYRSKDGRGQRIPTAHNFFKAMPKSLGYQLEIKTGTPTKKQLQNLVTATRAKQPNGSKVFFTSNHRHVLEYLSKIAPEYQRGLIMVDKNRISASSIPSYVDSINIHQAVATKSYVHSVHKRGKQVLARSAESPSAWRRLISLNTERIVTDNIHHYTKWCRSVR